MTNRLIGEVPPMQDAYDRGYTDGFKDGMLKAIEIAKSNRCSCTYDPGGTRNAWTCPHGNEFTEKTPQDNKE